MILEDSINSLFSSVATTWRQVLLSSLPWLDNAFGIAERRVKQVRGKNYYYPAIYKANNEYIEAMPDDYKLGCFSFFLLHDPQEILPKFTSPVSGVVKAPFSLIVWVDLRKIYTAADSRDTEFVKEQILKTLFSRPGGAGTLKVSKIYERAENVFREFTISEIDNQYLMHPFAGFRFDGYMLAKMTCVHILPQPGDGGTTTNPDRDTEM